MPKWYEITRTEDYQSLPPKDQAEMKQRFFQKRILPILQQDDELKGEDAIQFAFENFMNTPDDTGQGYLKALGSSVVRGAGEVIPGTIEGIGALADIKPMQQAGRDVRGGLEELAPVNPIYQDDIGTKLANVTGNIGSMLATGGVGGLAGRALAAERIAAGTTTAARTAATARAFDTGAKAALYGTGAAQGAAGGAREAEKYGLEGPEAYLRTLAGAASEVIPEALPFGTALETALPRRLLGAGGEAMPGIRRAALTEGTEEAATQLGGNIATETLAPIGVETPGLTEGVLESAALGAFGGSLIGVAGKLTTPDRQTQVQRDYSAEAGAIPMDEVPDQTEDEKKAGMEKGFDLVVDPTGKTAYVPPKIAPEVLAGLSPAEQEELGLTPPPAPAPAPVVEEPVLPPVANEVAVESFENVEASADVAPATAAVLNEIALNENTPEVALDTDRGVGGLMDTTLPVSPEAATTSTVTTEETETPVTPAQSDGGSQGQLRTAAEGSIPTVTAPMVPQEEVVSSGKTPVQESELTGAAAEVSGTGMERDEPKPDNAKTFNRFVSDLDFYGTAKFENIQFTIKQASDETFYVEKTANGERTVLSSGFPDLGAAKKSAIESVRQLSTKTSSVRQPASVVESKPEERGASVETIASGGNMSVQEARAYLERKSETGEPLIFGRPWSEISGMQQQNRPPILRIADKFKGAKQIVSDISRFKIPVYVSVADSYGITLPEGYVKQGDLYVYKPQPPVSDALPQQISGSSVLRQERSEVELPQVAQGNAEEQAGEVRVQEAVKPKVEAPVLVSADTLPDTEASREAVDNEFTNLSDATPVTDADIDTHLSDSDKQTAVSELGGKSWEQVRTQFKVEFANFLSGVGTASRKLVEVFKKLVSAMRTVALTAALVFTPSNSKYVQSVSSEQVKSFSLPQPAPRELGTLPQIPRQTLPTGVGTTQGPMSLNINLSQFKPKADFGKAKAPSKVKEVADFIVGSGNNEGYPFIVADKQGGLVYVFDQNGKLAGKAAALYGKDKGDEVILDTPEWGEASTGRVTPSGRFFATPDTSDSEYGFTLDFLEREYSTLAIHKLYLGTPSEQRPKRLSTQSPLDNRISYGCINLDEKVMDGVVEPLFANAGGFVYVLPETAKGRKAFDEQIGRPLRPKLEAGETVVFKHPSGQPVIGTIKSVVGGNATVNYNWNGKKEQEIVVRTTALSRPAAALAAGPSYQYTQEQNARKAARVGLPSEPGFIPNAGKVISDALEKIASDTALPPMTRAVARALQTQNFDNVDLRVEADGRYNYAGYYLANKDLAEIRLNLRQVARGQVDTVGTFLHEALHHVTLAKLRDPQGEVETQAVQALDTLRKRVRAYAGMQQKASEFYYELGSTEEFVSAVFTNPEFQDFLASIPDTFAPDTPASKFRSVLSEVFRYITQLVTGKSVQKGSAIEQAMTATLALFETRQRPAETEGEAAMAEDKDAEYMAAVQRGDMATAQRMVVDRYRDFIRSHVMLGDKFYPVTYIRFGNPPSDQFGKPTNSIGFDGGVSERGVSVLGVWHDPVRGKYVIPSGSEQAVAGISDLVIQDRPVFVVSGKVLEDVGSDTEPLMEAGSIKLEKRLSYSELLEENEPNFTLDGESYDPGEEGTKNAYHGGKERWWKSKGVSLPSTAAVIRDKDGEPIKLSDRFGPSPGTRFSATTEPSATKTLTETQAKEALTKRFGQQVADKVIVAEFPAISLRKGEEPVEVDAFLKGGKIHLNLKFIDSEEMLIAEAEHEMAHAVWSNLRVQGAWKDLRASMPDDVKQRIADKVRGLGYNPADIDEETMVRFFEEVRAATSPSKWQAFMDAVINAFRQFFGFAPDARTARLAAAKIIAEAESAVARGLDPVSAAFGAAVSDDGTRYSLRQQDLKSQDWRTEPAAVELVETKPQQQTVNEAGKIIGEFLKDAENPYLARRAALNHFTSAPGLRPEVRMAGLYLLARQMDLVANSNAKKGRDAEADLYDDEVHRALAAEAILRNDPEAWQNLKFDIDSALALASRDAGLVLNIVSRFNNMTQEGFIRRKERAIKRNLDNVVAAETGGKTSDDLYNEIARIWQLMREAGPGKRGEAIAAALKAFMPKSVSIRNIIDAQSPQAGFREKMEKEGEQLVRNFFQMIAGPRDPKGPLAEFDSVIQNALSDSLRRAMEKAGLLKKNESVQMTDIDKLVRAVSTDSLRLGKLAKADEAMQAELDAIEDPERRAMLQQAWDEAMARMATTVAPESVVRRAVNAELQDLKINWNEFFDKGGDVTALRNKVTAAVLNKVTAKLNVDDVMEPGGLGSSNIAKLKEEIKNAFEFAKEMKRQSWLAYREEVEIRRRIAERKKAFLEALKDQRVAESAIARIGESLAGPPKPGAPKDPVNELVNAQVKKPDPEFVKKLGALGVNEETARQLEALIEKSRADAAEAKPFLDANKAVEQFIKSMGREPTKKAVDVLTPLARKIVTAATADALSRRDFQNALAEAFDVPVMTQQQADEFRDLVRRINEIPDGVLQDDLKKEMNAKLAQFDGIPAVDMLMSAWYSNVLSGPATTFLQLFGNAFNTALKSGLSALSNNPKDTLQAFRGAFTSGLRQGLNDAQLAMQGRSQFKPTATTDRNTIGNLEILSQFGPRNWTDALAWVASAGTLTKYIFRLFSAIDAITQSFGREWQAYMAASRAARKEGKLGSPEYNAEFIRQLGGDTREFEAYLERAKEEQKKAGLPFDKRKVIQRAYELRTQDRPPEINRLADRFANQLTFTNKPEGIGRLISSIISAVQRITVGGFPVGRLLQPFNHIISNMFEQSLDYTPFGLIRGGLGGHLTDIEVVRGKFRLRQGATRFDALERRQRIAASMVGTAAALAIYGLAKAFKDRPDEDVPFMIYGMGPPTKDKRDNMPQGWAPNTIKIGDTYYKYAETPLNTLLGGVGAVMDAMRYGKLDEKNDMDRLTYIASSAMKGLLNQGVLTNLRKTFEVFTGDATASSLKSIPVSTIKGMLPFSGAMKEAAIIADPTKVSDDTLRAALLRDIPVAKGYAGNPDLNRFGEPIKFEGLPVVRRVMTQRVENHVSDWLGRNSLDIPGMGRTIEVGQYLPKAAKTWVQRKALQMGAAENGVFTPEQDYRFKQRAGQLTKAAVERLMTLKKNPRPAEREQLQKIINKEVESARRKAMMEIVREDY